MKAILIIMVWFNANDGPIVNSESYETIEACIQHAEIVSAEWYRRHEVYKVTSWCSMGFDKERD